MIADSQSHEGREARENAERFDGASRSQSFSGGERRDSRAHIAQMNQRSSADICGHLRENGFNANGREYPRISANACSESQGNAERFDGAKRLQTINGSSLGLTLFNADDRRCASLPQMTADPIPSSN
jgi:hypothetical protein